MVEVWWWIVPDWPSAKRMGMCGCCGGWILGGERTSGVGSGNEIGDLGRRFGEVWKRGLDLLSLSALRDGIECS